MFTNRKFNTDVRSLRQELNKQNCITVHIWHSGSNIHEKGENVGHASLECSDGTYMSLWPRGRAKLEEGTGVTKPIGHKFVGSYKKDKEKEDRGSETRICFYSLDVDAIKHQFNTFKTELVGWCLLGGVCKDAQSCVSLVWKLLEKGGIRNLVSQSKQGSILSGQSTMGSILASKHLTSFKSRLGSKDSFYSSEAMVGLLIKSPDMLIPLLKSAKDTECKKSEFSSLRFPGETYHPSGVKKETKETQDTSETEKPLSNGTLKP